MPVKGSQGMPRKATRVDKNHLYKMVSKVPQKIEKQYPVYTWWSKMHLYNRVMSYINDWQFIEIILRVFNTLCVCIPKPLTTRLKRGLLTPNPDLESPL